MAKILLVEDDVDLSTMISARLEAENHIVEVAHDGRVGYDYMMLTKYDVIILDWNLPTMEGVDVLKEYRKNGGASPVIFLTGRDEISEKEVGLDSGADDYLTKPFNTRELSARIRALMRRPEAVAREVFTSGDLSLDASNHRLTKNGKDAKLQPKDFSLLEFFMRNPDRPFSPDALLQRVWHADSDASIDGLRAAIKRIRKVIDGSSSEDDSYIETMPRVGYRFKKK